MKGSMMAGRSKGDTKTMSGKSSTVVRHKQRLQVALHSQVQELRVLHDISQHILTSLDLNRTLEGILAKACPIGPFDLANIRLLDASGKNLELAASRGYRHPENLRRHRKSTSDTTTGRATVRALTEKKSLILEDVLECEGLRTLKAEDIRSAVVIPVRAGGEVLGIVELGSRTQRKFRREQISLLEAIGSQMGVAAQKIRLYEETKRQAQELSALHTVTAAVSSSLDLDDLLDKALHAALLLTGMEAGYIRLLDGAPPQLKLRVQKGFSADFVDKLQRGMRAGGKAHQAISTGKSIVLENIPTEHAGELEREALAEGFVTFAWVPIISKDKVLGLINVATRGTQTLTSGQIPMLESIGTSIGTAIDNAYLYQETERRRKHAEALFEIGLSLTATHDPQQVLDLVAEEARRLTHALFAFVVTPDKPYYKIAAVAGNDRGYREVLKLSDDPASPYGRGPLGQAIRSKKPVVCEDVLTDPLFLPWREIASARAIRSLVAVPLVIRSDACGAIITYATVRSAYDAETLNLLSSLSALAAAALENTRLYKEASQKSQEIEGLYNVTNAISESLDIQSIIHNALLKTIEVLRVDAGRLYLLEESSGTLHLTAHHGFPPEAIAYYESYAPGEGVVGKIFVEARPIVFSDMATDPNYTALARQARGKELGFHSAAGLPITVKGRSIGVIYVYGRDVRVFTPQDLDLLSAIGRQIGVAIENARLFEETQQRAREQEVLNTIAMAVSQSLDLTEILQISIDQVLEVTGRERGYIRLRDPTTGEVTLAAHRGISEEYVQILLHKRTTGGKTDQVFNSGEPLIINDPQGTILKEETRREGTRSLAWIPLKARGKVVGVLNISTSRRLPFQRRDVELLKTVGNVIGVALEKAQLFREAERQAEEQAVLNEIATAVSRSLNLDELLQISLDKVLHITGREKGYIRLKDTATGELKLLAHRGISETYAEALVSRRTAGGKSDQVFESGLPLVVNDIGQNILRDQTLQEGNQSIAWIPLKAQGKVLGTLNVATARPISFEPREVQLLEAIGNIIGVALKNAQLFEDSNGLVQELKGLTRQLTAKNKELDTFVYTVSHDLKAPLVSLQGMADLLLDEYGGKLDGQAQHYLERLKANTKQMERLVLDLLALSRIGREGRPPEAVAIDQVVEDLLLEWGEAIRARGVHVVRRSLPTLWGVRTQIEQVMRNLITNAIKYLGDTAEPQIEIGVKDGASQMVECYVKDNGIGIDPEYHEKVFGIFQRLKEVEAEGTGVGLAIVKKVIEGAGGRIWVESEKGRGATFRFTWPKVQKEVNV